jgi:hypothetical protein
MLRIGDNFESALPKFQSDGAGETDESHLPRSSRTSHLAPQSRAG